jgi:hypothetical protein
MLQRNILNRQYLKVDVGFLRAPRRGRRCESRGADDLGKRDSPSAHITIIDIGPSFGLHTTPSI